MKVSVTDIHDSHGSVFTLNLMAEENKEEDGQVIVILKRFLQHMRSGRPEDKSVLYSYGVEDLPLDGISLKLVEGQKELARVNYRWNPTREDQKYIVVVLEGDPENNTETKYAKHYTCHWCKEETWGVSRDTAEIYDSKTKSMKIVSMCHECRMVREKQIAKIPFSAK